MLKQFQQLSPIYRFLVGFACLSVGWYLLYTFLLSPYTNFDMVVINSTLSVTESILEMLGHSTFIEGRTIRIAGTSGLWVGDNCNAISLFALFSGFIIAFPGQLKSKLWYVPAGIFLIFFLNCIRMTVLAILDIYSREWTKFNHTYTFTIIIYGFIFLMWMFWVNRYSFIKKNKKAVE
jgi:exosortase family protein XrtF